MQKSARCCERNCYVPTRGWVLDQNSLGEIQYQKLVKPFNEKFHNEAFNRFLGSEVVFKLIFWAILYTKDDSETTR